MKKVSFMDMAVCLNCHVFIIWGFIRRYGYTAGVTKDKYGRGYAEAQLCNGWIDKLAKYVAAQDFTYKQPINLKATNLTWQQRRRIEREFKTVRR